MDYVEQLQSLDETAGRQVIFDALNAAAMVALSDMKNESTTTNNKKLDVFHDNELVHTTSNAKTKQEAIKQAKLKYPEKTGIWAAAVHTALYGNDKKLTEESLDEMSDEDFDSLVENIEQLDELSKTTLGNYIKKASKSHADNEYKSGKSSEVDDESENDIDQHKSGFNRFKNINKAIDKLSPNNKSVKNSVSNYTGNAYSKGVVDARKENGYINSPEESNMTKSVNRLNREGLGRIEKGVKKLTKEDTDQLDESVTVHVQSYSSKPDKKDTDHVKSGVELHDGTYDGSSDKGSYFKFKDEESAKKFKSHVNKSPNKTTFADILTESTQLDESRKIDQFENGIHKATVHKDSDTGEYKVKFHTNGKHLKDADYFTDEKDDAIGTAKDEIIRMHSRDTE